LFRGGTRFSFQRGTDGVGDEVSLDVSKVSGNPVAA